MTTLQATIDQAVDLAAKGSPKDGIHLLWPLIRDEAARDEALFALAYCFEKDENFATAEYLYQQILTAHPDFDVAAKHLAECESALEERGLIEDFNDDGHALCPCASFQQRAEYGACPYCGLKPGETAEDLAREAALAQTEVAELVDEPGGFFEPSTLDQIRDAGLAAIERIKEWAKREDIAPTTERLEILKDDVKDRVREFSEKEEVKKVTRKAGEFGREMSTRVKDFTESGAAQEVVSKTREVGEEVSERVKDFSDKPEVQETKSDIERAGRDAASIVTEWTKSERVQRAFRRTVDTLEGCLAVIQAGIDRIKK